MLKFRQIKFPFSRPPTSQAARKSGAFIGALTGAFVVVFVGACGPTPATAPPSAHRERGQGLEFGASRGERPAAGIKASPRLNDRFVFNHEVEPLELLDPKSAQAIAIDNASRAFIDPGPFLANGLVLLNPNGELERYGLCRAILDDTAWIMDCERDIGRFLNAMFKYVFQHFSVLDDIAANLAAIADFMRHTKTSAELSLASADLESDEVKASVRWNVLHFPAPIGTLDLAALGLTGWSSSAVGRADVVDEHTQQVLLLPAKVNLNYVSTAMAVLHTQVLPRLVPQLDQNQDKAVSLTELFSALQQCDLAPRTEIEMCQTSSQSLATLINAGLLSQLQAPMDQAWSFHIEAQLRRAEMVSLEGALHLQGENSHFELATTTINAISSTH